MRTWRAVRVFGGLLITLAVAVGCAAPQQQPEARKAVDPEARLVERVKAYWETRVKGDLIETYRFHEPNFRKKVTLTAFAQGRGASTILDYEVKSVRIEDAKGFVAMRLYYTIIHPRLAKPVEPRWQEVEEQWRLVDGEWYRRFRFPVGDPYPDHTAWDAPPPEAAGQSAPPPPPRQ